MINRDGKVTEIKRVDKNTLSIEITFKDGYIIFRTENKELSIDDNIKITVEKE